MMAGGGPPGPGQQMVYPDEMIGAIKIKDGLFIGDEMASTVSKKSTPLRSDFYE